MSEARIPFRLADLYTLRHVSDPAVSPDGQRVAFVVQGYRKKDNDRYQNIWLARTDGAGEPHRLTRGASSDGSPAWSADNRYLAFLSTREHEVEVAAVLAEEEEAKKKKEKGKAEAAGGDPGTAEGAGEAGDGGGGGDNAKPKPQIWILDTEFGGEPRQITWREEGVSEFDWSPDGRQLVFAARDPDAKQKKYLKSVRGGEKGKDRGPIVLDRVQHKHDGVGYLDDVRTHLFVVEVASRAARQLTRGPVTRGRPVGPRTAGGSSSSPTAPATRTTTFALTCGSSGRTAARPAGSPSVMSAPKGRAGPPTAGRWPSSRPRSPKTSTARVTS